MSLPSDELRYALSMTALPETVYSFFTDPDRLVRWMGRRAEIEPSLGGLFSSI